MSKHKKSSQKHGSPSRSGTSISLSLPFSVLAGVTLIVGGVFLAYLPAISGEFILDDDGLLTESTLIKASDGLYRFWCTTEALDYWPVSNTTLWIEWRLWGMNPTGYHVSNLILHIVESLLIWVILRKLSIPGAFLAAMIFAVHPVNVESVAWIAQRKDMLAVLFFLLSILCYLRFLMRAHRPTSWRPFAAKQIQSIEHCPPLTSSFILHPSSFHIWYWLSLAAFVLAMLSKGTAAVLPVLLLGIVWWMRPLTRWDLVRSAPFFLVAAALTVVNVWSQTHGTGEAIRTAGFIERLLGAGGVVWFYLYKALLPFDLAFVYPQWHIQVVNPLWWLPLTAALIVTAVLWGYRESWSRALLFAWGFFCVALAPVMGFTDTGFMKFSLVADHYQHIAIMGVIALVAAGWSIWRRRARGAEHWTATAIAVAAVGVLAFLTWRQSEIYRDKITLYRTTLAKNPDCWLAYENWGCALFDMGRPLEAIIRYEQALKLKPDYAEAYIDLGKAVFKIGRHEEAIKDFKKALEIRPKYINAYGNMALAYAKMHQSSEAIGSAQKALDIARSRGQTTVAKQIEDWLNAYRARLSGLPQTPSPSKSALPPP